MIENAHRSMQRPDGYCSRASVGSYSDRLRWRWTTGHVQRQQTQWLRQQRSGYRPPCLSVQSAGGLDAGDRAGMHGLSQDLDDPG